MKQVLAVCLAAALAAGCSIIMPADRDMIHQNRLNAEAVAAKVQAIPIPSDADWTACQTWFAQEARTWRALDAWAQGKKPEVTP